MRTAAIALLALACAASGADKKRDPAVRAEFMREHPCPSTGQTRGACPGFQADHRIALCAGGADRASNLQWLTIAEHQRKTRQDLIACRSSRR